MYPGFFENADGEPVLAFTDENGVIQTRQPHKKELRICVECREYYDRDECSYDKCPDCSLKAV